MQMLVASSPAVLDQHVRRENFGLGVLFKERVRILVRWLGL